MKAKTFVRIMISICCLVLCFLSLFLKQYVTVYGPEWLLHSPRMLSTPIDCAFSGLTFALVVGACLVFVPWEEL